MKPTPPQKPVPKLPPKTFLLEKSVNQDSVNKKRLSSPSAAHALQTQSSRQLNSPVKQQHSSPLPPRPNKTHTSPLSPTNKNNLSPNHELLTSSMIGKTAPPPIKTKGPSPKLSRSISSVDTLKTSTNPFDDDFQFQNKKPNTSTNPFDDDFQIQTNKTISNTSPLVADIENNNKEDSESSSDEFEIVTLNPSEKEIISTDNGFKHTITHSVTRSKPVPPTKPISPTRGMASPTKDIPIALSPHRQGGKFSPSQKIKIELDGPDLVPIDYNQHVQNIINQLINQSTTYSPIITCYTTLLSSLINDFAHYDYLIQRLKKKVPFLQEEMNIEILHLLSVIVSISDERSLSIAVGFLNTKFSEKTRNAATSLISSMSRHHLTDVVDIFHQVMLHGKNDETVREMAVMINGFCHIILPVEGIEVSQSIRFISEIESAIATAQRSVHRNALCNVLDGITKVGLGRGNGIVLSQLEDLYGKIIDSLRKWKSNKVPVNITCAHLGAQTDGLYALSIQPILKHQYQLLLNAKDQHKRIKSLEIISDYVSGMLDVLPRNHTLIQPTLDEYVTKTILPKKEYIRLKYVSGLEIPSFVKVLKHHQIYDHLEVINILSMTYSIPTDLLGVFILHLPPIIPLPSSAQSGITNFLTTASTLIGTVMDPTNIWSLEIYPNSFTNDSAAKTAVAHKIIDAARSPILPIKLAARDALLRDAKQNNRLFTSLFEDILTVFEDDNIDDVDFLSKLAFTYTTPSSASAIITKNLLRRSIRLLLNLDETSVAISKNIATAVNSVAFDPTKFSCDLKQLFDKMSINGIDDFIIRNRDVDVIVELHARLIDDYTIKTPIQIVRFLYAALCAEHQKFIDLALSQYFDNDTEYTTLFHSLTPRAVPRVIDYIAKVLEESKKKKFPLELFRALVSIPIDNYKLCPKLTALCRSVISKWVSCRDLPTSPSQNMLLKKSVGNKILVILSSLTKYAMLTDPISVLATIDAIITIDPETASQCIANLLHKYPTVLPVVLPRCFGSRDARSIYIRAVHIFFTSNSIIKTEDILSYSVVLAATSPCDFASLVAATQLFPVDLVCSPTNSPSWLNTLMLDTSNYYAAESPIILAGVVQYYPHLQAFESIELLPLLCPWFAVAVRADLQEALNILLDIILVTPNISNQLLPVLSTIAQNLNDVSNVVGLLLHRATSNESIVAIGKILAHFASFDTLSEGVFDYLWNGLLALPTQPTTTFSQPEIVQVFPNKSQTQNFSVISRVIGVARTSATKYFARVMALALLFYAPNTPCSEREEDSRIVIKTIGKLHDKNCFGNVQLNKIAQEFSQCGIIDEFNNLLLNCAVSLQMEVALNAIDIFHIFHDALGTDKSFNDSQINLISRITFRAVLFGEAELLTKVMKLVTIQPLMNIISSSIELPIVSVFHFISKVVDAEDISDITLARAAGNSKTFSDVKEITMNLKGIKGWIGTLLKTKNETEIIQTIQSGIEEFGLKQIVDLLIVISQGDYEVLVKETVRFLVGLDYQKIDARIAGIVASKMSMNDIGVLCAKFMVKYKIVMNIPNTVDTQILLFSGVTNEELVEKRYSSIEKLSKYCKETIDKQKIIKIIKSHSIDLKKCSTPYAL
ncbi:Uncharacterized protein QTN25_007865 [Entamoeba marina]